MILTETATSYPKLTIDANIAAWHDNMEALVAYAGDLWVHTPVTVYLNYYLHSGASTFHNGDVAALRLFQVMKAHKVGWGSPDMYSAQPGKRYYDQGSRIMRGVGVQQQDPAHPEYGTNDYGTENFVPEMPKMASWESCCDYAPEDVYDYYHTVLKNNFTIWSVQTDLASVDAPTDRRFKFVFTGSGGVRDYVNGRGAPSSECPALYGGTCATP
jgi:hypothetical protein